MSDLILGGLLPELEEKAREHRRRGELIGIDVVFTSGFRSTAEQMAAFAKGRMLDSDTWKVVDPRAIVTNAMPDHAPHCRRAAYDLVPIVAEKAAWDRLDLFAELGRIGKELGLVWGGDWPKLKDMPHFELPGWRSFPLARPA